MKSLHPRTYPNSVSAKGKGLIHRLEKCLARRPCSHTRHVSVCSWWFGMRKYTLRHMNMNYGGFWQGENRNFGLRPPKLLDGAFTVRWSIRWDLGFGREVIVWHISAGIVLYRRDGFRKILGKPLQFSNKLWCPLCKRRFPCAKGLRRQIWSEIWTRSFRSLSRCNLINILIAFS